MRGQSKQERRRGKEQKKKRKGRIKGNDEKVKKKKEEEEEEEEGGAIVAWEMKGMGSENNWIKLKNLNYQNSKPTQTDWTKKPNQLNWIDRIWFDFFISNRKLLSGLVGSYEVIC